MKNPVSSKALYDCSKGKPHGRWALLNGVVNDKDVVAEVKSCGTTLAALKRLRVEEMEEALRKEFDKSRKAETYANNVLSWGVGIYEHCNGIQKLLETSATNQGVPLSQIPPPPVPPPARSPSPDPPVQIIQTTEYAPAEDVPVLCAQRSEDPYYEHIQIQTDDIAQDLNLAPNAGAGSESLFGGFFSENESGELSLTLLLGSSQPS